jgi:threonine dehydrogenase-like Zn-dependent dehydrogenase
LKVITAQGAKIMRKLICKAPGIAELTGYEDLPIRPNEVKVRVLFASPKHGTEIADFRGTTPFIDGKYDPEWQIFKNRDEDEPRGLEYGDLPLGNMFVGIIIEAGENVTDYRIGDRVCSYGSIRETQIVNAVGNYRLRKMKADDSERNAVCYDPAQFALGGIRDANVRAGDNVAVIGLGAIGQIAVQLAAKAGAANVIAIDPIPKRREIALKHGAHFALDPVSCDAGLEIKRLTGKAGADSIIETSGSVNALQTSLKGLAYGGIISYVAFAKPFPAGLWLGQEAHFNYGRIVFSRAGSEPNPEYPRWSRRRIEDVSWELLMNGYLDCEDIIDPIVDFDDCAEGFKKYVDLEPDLSIKLGIAFRRDK